MTKLEVQVVQEASKRMFGLKTVVLSFEYGAFVGVLFGSIGGFLLARTYDSQDLSRTEKMSKIGKLSLYSIGGIASFMGVIKVIGSFKMKGFITK